MWPEGLWALAVGGPHEGQGGQAQRSPFPGPWTPAVLLSGRSPCISWKPTANQGSQVLLSIPHRHISVD